MNAHKMIACGTCGFALEQGERLHPHLPDFYIRVRNCRAELVRIREFEDGTTRGEPLPFEFPDERWIAFVLDTCGGSILRSGVYRLPGMMWEWVIARCAQDETSARFLEARIGRLLDRLGYGGER